jgi:hypothetical protein
MRIHWVKGIIPRESAVLQNNFLIVSWLRENGNQTTFGETRYFVFLTCIDVQVHITVQKQMGGNWQGNVEGGRLLSEGNLVAKVQGDGLLI